MDAQFELHGLSVGAIMPPMKNETRPPCPSTARPGENNAPGRRGGVYRSPLCVRWSEAGASTYDRRTGDTRRARTEQGAAAAGTKSEGEGDSEWETAVPIPDTAAAVLWLAHFQQC